ncbi:hypothetical protein [Leekyejoonella antrihumi]|uniref:Uncharacterized protein n=1 Tax=Leekyejoonella antrihumi TaxID=1660198 RepID=A0A563DQD5_9MICO|nr:hypothetical protein [Leekyejoonella antrihumi]TWP32447.1 hypothetical protein FGL98_24210 [Leekyejoonella antrihumi]
MAELKGNSQLAIAGTFAKSQNASGSDGIPMTAFTVTVNQILFDRSATVEANAEITVMQTGGQAAGVLSEATDDPLFTVGSRAVLFLDRSEKGTYFVSGGPTGRFNLDQNDQVSTFSPQSAKLDGTLASVAAQVAAAG